MPAKDVKKEVRYLNRDFASFRNNLIELDKKTDEQTSKINEILINVNEIQVILKSNKK